MMVSHEKIKELKAKAHHIEPVVWVGKSGINNKVLDEINKQLKKKKLIKVKILKPALAERRKKDIARELAEKTGSTLVSQIGFIAVLYRARSAKNI